MSCWGRVAGSGPSAGGHGRRKGSGSWSRLCLPLPLQWRHTPGWVGGVAGHSEVGFGGCGFCLLRATPKVRTVHQGSRVRLPKAPLVAPEDVGSGCGSASAAFESPVISPRKIPFSAVLLPRRLIWGLGGEGRVRQPQPGSPNPKARDPLASPVPSDPLVCFPGQGPQAPRTCGGGWCSGTPRSPRLHLRCLTNLLPPQSVF